jgi:uncharacterized protein YjbI with pentapeptide repeats
MGTMLPGLNVTKANLANRNLDGVIFEDSNL